MNFIMGYLYHCLYLALMASISFSYWYNYQLLVHLGLGFSVLIGFYVAASIFLTLKLMEHPNPKIRSIAEFYGRVYTYTSLFQGTVLTNLTFYVIGSINDFTLYEMHMSDWIYGMTYSGFIVYGIGCILSPTLVDKFISKLMCILIVLIHWASFVYLLVYEENFRLLFKSHSNLIISISFAIQLISSVVMIKETLGTALEKNEKKRSSKNN